jgi:uncharacterized linocin/CFP29 family protein
VAPGVRIDPAVLLAGFEPVDAGFWKRPREDTMADNSAGPGWSDAQWERINNAVTEEFAKASVVSAFLPCYGPLASSAETVRNELLTDNGSTVRVTDDATLKLFNLTVKVELSSEQIADESLSSALLAFRRAANRLAQVEDDIVFNGVPPERLPVMVSGPKKLLGLTKVKAAVAVPRPARSTRGEVAVRAVATAIASLENDCHPGPFACVLATDLFVDVHTPDNSLVLPADRITPILNGPLLRSGQLRRDHGIVVSLSGGAIDVVVATPPKAQFLQMTPDARSLFRVYERFVLRVKEEDEPAVSTFTIAPDLLPDGSEAGVDAGSLPK